MQTISFRERLLKTTPHLFVTPLLTSINVGVFAVMALLGVDLFDPDGWIYIDWGANYGPLTASGQWWRLVTHAFLHFGIIHLLFNMWVLFEVGRLVERLYGPVFFALIYLGAAITGGFASIIWHEGSRISVGASGAIFGVYGALLAYLLSRGNTLPRAIIRNLLFIALVFVGISIGYGLSQQGIDNAAHVGGLVGGFALGLITARALEPEPRQRNSWVRLAFGVVGLAGLSFALASQIPKPDYNVEQELKFQITVDWFRDQEEAANTSFNNLVRQAKDGQIKAKEFANQLESQSLPRWQAVYRRLTGNRLTNSSPSFDEYRLLLDFSQTRRDALLALIEGLREQNAPRIQEFHALQSRAERILEEMNQVPHAGEL